MRSQVNSGECLEYVLDNVNNFKFMTSPDAIRDFGESNLKKIKILRLFSEGF